MIKKLSKNLRPFIKYCIVGATGTFIDLASLYVFVEYFLIAVIPAAVLSFLLAVTNNFIFNKIWTFNNKSKNYRKLYIKFLIVSVVGLGLTVLSMHVMVNIIGIWYMFAKALTSLIVLTWNFIANNTWTFRTKHRKVILSDKFPFKLSIIIPAFNEAERIKNTLLVIHGFIKKKKIKAEIIVVNDGSKDKTAEVVEEFKKKIPELKLVDLSKNSGKGFAVRKGVEESKGELILFADADNSTPIEEFEKLLKKMRENSAQIAIGSRYLNDSDIKVKQPTYRIMIGRVGNFLIRLFLIRGIKDTQCGFKLFENHAAKKIFSVQKIKRFAFDMETLVISENINYKIVEVPVIWLNSTESRVNPIKDSLRTLRDLAYIKLNLWSGRYSSD